MIPIKTLEEIKIMREGGKILAKIMKTLEKAVKPGIMTKKLDEMARDLISKYKASPSFLNYKESSRKNAKLFPAALCVSLNEVIVHDIPSNRILKQGDIVSLDLGILWKNFHTDMAITIPVGKVSSEASRLIRITKKALKRGIKKVRPGNTFGDIGNTIQRYVESQGFDVVRDLCGHGIGKELHEEPQILNYGKRHKGEKIKQGMVFCLEPMVMIGDCCSNGRASSLVGKIKKSENGYGWETYNGNLSCHFEHTIAVTDNGCEILTKI